MKLNWKRPLAAVLSAMMILGVSAPAVALDDDPGFVISYSRVAGLEVYVDDELDAGQSQNSVVCGEVVRLTAPAVENKTFSHWAFGSADGTAASTRNPWQFALQSDTAVYAVYDEDANAVADAAKLAVAFSSIIKENRMDRDYIRMTAAYSLPSTVIDPLPSASNPVLGEVGIRYTTKRMLGLGDEVLVLLGDEPEEDAEGFDVAALLKSNEVKKGVRVSSDQFYYAMGDWTVGLGNPGDGVRVYAVAYVTWNGQTVFSDVKEIVYSELKEGSVLSANVSDPFTFPTEQQQG